MPDGWVRGKKNRVVPGRDPMLTRVRSIRENP